MITHVFDLHIDIIKKDGQLSYIQILMARAQHYIFLFIF